MNTKPLLSGKRLDLRRLDPDGDLSAYLAWVNDQQTTRYMTVGKRPMTRGQLREYIQRYNDSSDLLLGIFVRDTGCHIGNITLHQIDARNHSAEIGILIGDYVPSSAGPCELLQNVTWTWRNPNHEN